MSRGSAAIVLIIGLGLGQARAQCPVPYVGAVVFAPGAEVSVCMTPGGNGMPLAAARLVGGGIVDATIRVQLVDWNGIPVANFSAADIWIQSERAQPVIHSCEFTWASRIFCPDRNTDRDGWTEFALPLPGGGSDPGPLRVYLNGNPAYRPDGYVFPPLAIRLNSPDLNADGLVDLLDVAPFAADYFGPYAMRSDFDADGTVSLSDLPVLAGVYGERCAPSEH